MNEILNKIVNNLKTSDLTTLHSMYDTTQKLAQDYRETQNLDMFRKVGKLWSMYGDLSTGGAFIVDTEKYLQAGGENENFL